MRTFRRRISLPVPRSAAFAWHARPGAFERLAPPWQDIRVVERTGGITDGSRLVMTLHAGPFRQRWVAQHTGYVDGEEFTDEQVAGPFAHWRHRHRILADGDAASVLEDTITYALPLGPLGDLVGGRLTHAMLERLFAFRHARTRDDLRRHAMVTTRGPLRVAITGASGVIGRQLAAFLTTGGHTVLRLVRHAPTGAAEVAWDPRAGAVDGERLEGLDAVVHLAGEPVAGRWTPERMAAIRASRVDGTAVLARALAARRRPPRVLLSASAVGYYGDRGATPVDETSPPGHGVLADVCRDWEAAAAPAVAAGIRVVHPRIGIALSAQGGALATMATPFRLGLGGVVGSGRQTMSWVALDDVVGALHHLLFADQVHGPVNVTAPDPVPNAVFVRTLAAVLRRPAILPFPDAAVRALFGRMGEEVLLQGAHVEPRVLLASGFRFLHADLASAMRDELGA